MLRLVARLDVLLTASLDAQAFAEGFELLYASPATGFARADANSDGELTASEAAGRDPTEFPALASDLVFLAGADADNSGGSCVARCAN